MYQHKQFVLFSGGLDSATVLYYAMKKWPKVAMSQDERFAVEAVSIDYGQRHSKEIDYAMTVAANLGLKHTRLLLPATLLSGVMLTSESAAIPDKSYAELGAGISPTYVPFRNGLMISLLAAYAQKWVMQAPGSDAPAKRHATIYIGAHSDDAANDAYPDCSPPFLHAMMEAVSIGTYESVSLEAPLSGMEKAAVVQMGYKFGVPFDMTWSCYKGEALHCGICPTCRARKEAFQKAGVNDPTQYAAD